MMTPEEIKLIYQDMVVDIKNSNGGVVGYDIDEVAFAHRIIKAHLAKCQDVCTEKPFLLRRFSTAEQDEIDKMAKDVCPECGDGKVIWLDKRKMKYKQCPTCQGGRR